MTLNPEAMKSASTPGQVGPGRHEAKRPRMIESQRIVQHVLRCPVDDFPRRPAGFRRVFVQLMGENVLEVALPRPFAGQTLNPLDQYFRHVVREFAHRFLRHLQHENSTLSVKSDQTYGCFAGHTISYLAAPQQRQRVITNLH